MDRWMDEWMDGLMNGCLACENSCMTSSAALKTFVKSESDSSDKLYKRKPNWVQGVWKMEFTRQWGTWMYYKNWILEIVPIRSNKSCSPGAYTKKVYSFRVYGQLNMCSSVNPIMPLALPGCSYTVVTSFRKKLISGLWKGFIKIKSPWLKNIQCKE